MNRLCERTFGAASELESNYNGPFFFFFYNRRFIGPHTLFMWSGAILDRH